MLKGGGQQTSPTCEEPTRTVGIGREHCDEEGTPTPEWWSVPMKQQTSIMTGFVSGKTTLGGFS